MNKSILKLIKKQNNGKNKFKDLPRQHQYAIIHYMAIDGEAWDVPEGYDAEANSIKRTDFDSVCRFNRAYIKKNVKYWVDKHPNATFGMISLSRAETLDALRELHPDAVKDGEYDHPEKPSLKHYNEKWPVILSSFDDEFIQDGWHRLGVYLQTTMRKIPAVFFAD